MQCRPKCLYLVCQGFDYGFQNVDVHVLNTVYVIQEHEASET